MPISTVKVPKGWDLQHDIAVDPDTGRHTRFKLVTIGPRNQYIRSYIGTFPYGNINGVPFERALQQAVEHVLGIEKLQRLQLGPLGPYPGMLEDPAVAAMAQRMASRGQRLEACEAGFSGERDGRRYQGQIIFSNFISPGFGILAPGSAMFSLAEDCAGTHRVAEEIRRSMVRNPEHDRVMTSINERLRQQSDAHARRMMDQSAIAHQRRMADQQAVVDQIHGRGSFTDPWTNSQVALDGQYKHNFTNGLGDCCRTDDASFNPASLQGDWRRIDPLGP